MKRLTRITPATLDVLEVLVGAGDELHGFALAKAAHRPTGSIYLILSRLEEAGWVESRWEQSDEHNEGRPRRRFYRLTPDGLAVSRQTLAEKRKIPTAKSAATRRPVLHFGLLGRAR